MLRYVFNGEIVSILIPQQTEIAWKHTFSVDIFNRRLSFSEYTFAMHFLSNQAQNHRTYFVIATAMS